MIVTKIEESLNVAVRSKYKEYMKFLICPKPGYII